ncbi:MAG: hypothetical protein JEY97_09080 [Bacteroidales bacterium]|nr:hypothetical protein [Bacteroidales bacterium]
MVNEGDTYEYQYFLKDHLGNLQTITDETGSIIKRYSFDPRGRRRNPDTWKNLTYTEIQSEDFIFDRGYTGHEHLNQFGLVNMNGRLYDPLLGRMLSPDNYIQTSGNYQNFNRYYYALNNPLVYTDPSGEIIWFVPVIYAAVNVGVDLIMNDGIMNFGEIAMSAGSGALGGFLSGGKIASVGRAFLSAGVSQLNRLISSIPIYQSNNFNLSVSPMVGFGTSGFNFGSSLNAGGQIGDFAFSASFGVGYNSGVSSLGESGGGSWFRNTGGFVGWNYVPWPNYSHYSHKFT